MSENELRRILHFYSCPKCRHPTELRYLDKGTPYVLVCVACGHMIPIGCNYISTTYLHGVVNAITAMRTSGHSEETIICYIDACYQFAGHILERALDVSDRLCLVENRASFFRGFEKYKLISGRIRMQLTLIEMGFKALRYGYLTNPDYVCQN